MTRFSDWFVFAYPAVIPYHLFVIRITEEDFLKDPHTVLDHIKQKYTDQDRQQMRIFMKHWSQYLSYNPHRSTLLHYDTLYQVTTYIYKHAHTFTHLFDLSNAPPLPHTFCQYNTLSYFNTSLSFISICLSCPSHRCAGAFAVQSVVTVGQCDCRLFCCKLAIAYDNILLVVIVIIIRL